MKFFKLLFGNQADHADIIDNDHLNDEDYEYKQDYIREKYPSVNPERAPRQTPEEIDEVLSKGRQPRSGGRRNRRRG